MSSCDASLGKRKINNDKKKNELLWRFLVKKGMLVV